MGGPAAGERVRRARDQGGWAVAQRVEQQIGALTHAVGRTFGLHDAHAIQTGPRADRAVRPDRPSTSTTWRLPAVAAGCRLTTRLWAT